VACVREPWSANSVQLAALDLLLGSPAEQAAAAAVAAAAAAAPSPPRAAPVRLPPSPACGRAPAAPARCPGRPRRPLLQHGARRPRLPCAHAAAPPAARLAGWC